MRSISKRIIHGYFLEFHNSTHSIPLDSSDQNLQRDRRQVGVKKQEFSNLYLDFTSPTEAPAYCPRKELRRDPVIQ